MSGMIFKLVDIMEEQLVYYDYLLGLSNEKRDYIIDNSIDELQKVTELENKIINKNNGLEKLRLECIKDIADVLNVADSELTIKELVALIDGHNGSSELDEIAYKIKDKIELLKSANSHNKMLIQNSLEYIDYTMNAIYTSCESDPVVSGYGDENLINNTKLFDVTQ